MFSYCGNNPVIREDGSGKLWNIIGGIVVGAVIGGVSQAICNYIDGKPITEGLKKSVLTGALGGGLTAALPGASTLISVGMSVAESVVSDVQNGESISTVLVNATLSAGFAAATSGNSVFSNKKLISDSIKAIGKVLPGNHPKVKKAAAKLLKSTGKAILGEITSGVATGVFVNYVSEATKWYTNARLRNCYKAYTY